jgi:dihydrodipicolinate synthase/N-acetylneuraminate lyase
VAAATTTAAAQAKLAEVTKLSNEFGSIPAMKFALGQLGLRESYCRPPYVDLTDSRKAELKAKIAHFRQIAG